MDVVVVGCGCCGCGGCGCGCCVLCVVCWLLVVGLLVLFVVVFVEWLYYYSKRIIIDKGELTSANLFR